jgi:hypothetical protein
MDVLSESLTQDRKITAFSPRAQTSSAVSIDRCGRKGRRRKRGGGAGRRRRRRRRKRACSHADTCQNIRFNVLHPRRMSGRGRGKRGKEGREGEQGMRAREEGR